MYLRWTLNDITQTRLHARAHCAYCVNLRKCINAHNTRSITLCISLQCANIAIVIVLTIVYTSRCYHCDIVRDHTHVAIVRHVTITHNTQWHTTHTSTTTQTSCITQCMTTNKRSCMTSCVSTHCVMNVHSSFAHIVRHATMKRSSQNATCRIAWNATSHHSLQCMTRCIATKRQSSNASHFTITITNNRDNTTMRAMSQW